MRPMVLKVSALLSSNIVGFPKYHSHSTRVTAIRSQTTKDVVDGSLGDIPLSCANLLSALQIASLRDS
jgi:hypothetical protein